MSPVLLAIDSGGTAVKILAFDLQGQEVAHCMADVETTHFPDGRVERDPQALWQATAVAIREIVAACEGRKILGLGCTGFGNGVFLVDAAGQPARPGIVSVDYRAQTLVDRLNADGTAAALSQTTGHLLWGGQTLMQIVNLAVSEPDVIARTTWALSCKDYIRFQLTGEALTDPTDASGGGLVDIRTGDYATEVFKTLAAEPCLDLLPPIVPSVSVAGCVSAEAAAFTGLPRGLPVAGSMMDVAACALGAGATTSRVMTMIAGTWSINGLETATVNPGAMPMLNMLFRDGRRLVADGSPCSAANLSWFLEHGLQGRFSYEDANALVAASPVEARRCQFLPFIFGPEPRHGGFVNMDANDNTGTMLRAIMEAVAYQHLRHANEAVSMVPDEFPPVIRLAGGAARSAEWGQIFADVCKRPVELVQAEEVGALGVAICAAVACGAWASLEEAVCQMSSVRQIHTPNTEFDAFYAEGFARFQKLDSGILEVMKRIS